MRVRQTSIDVYHRIRDEGLLSRRRFEVYDYVFNNGPCTAKDILMARLPQGSASGTYSGRMSELRDMGVLQELGTVECQYTGNTVILWDVTTDLPRKLDKQTAKPTRKRLEQLREILIEVYKHPELPTKIRRLIDQRVAE